MELPLEVIFIRFLLIEMEDFLILSKDLYIIGMFLEIIRGTLKTINCMVHGILQLNLNLDFMERVTLFNIVQLFGFGITLEISGNGIPR